MPASYDLDTLFASAPAAIAILRGAELTFESVNSFYLQIVNRDRNIVGRSLRSVFPELAEQGIYDLFDGVRLTGTPFVASEMSVRFDRQQNGSLEEGIFQFSITPIGGELPAEALMVVAIELTAQVRARQKLQELSSELSYRERRFRTLIEAVAQMVWSTTPEGEVIEDSPSWRAFTGQTYDEWIGWGWLDALHPDDREHAAKAWRTAVENVAPYEVVYRVRRVDGTYATTLARGTPLVDDTGKIVEWIGCNYDLTAQLKAQEAAREHQRRLKLALAAGRMGMWEYDLGARIATASPELERLFGLPVGSFDGTLELPLRSLHPDDRARVVAAFERGLASEPEQQITFRVVPSAGAVRWVESFHAILRDDSGKPTRLVGVMADATERIEASEATAALRLRKILEGINDAFSVYDASFTVQFTNAAAAALIGKTPEEVIGRNIWELVPDAVGTTIHARLTEVARTGVAATFEDYFAPFDRHFEIHAYPIPGSGLAVYTRDVTERNRAHALERRLTSYSELRLEVSAAVSEQCDIPAFLQSCCENIVRRMPLSFARIWLVDSSQQVLELQASAGKYTHVDGGHARVPVGKFKIGKIARDKAPHLTNDIQNDPLLGDPAWARREGMVAFVGYPLLVHDRMIGVLAAFATERLPNDLMIALGGIGDVVAHGIERRRAEIALAERAKDLARSNAELEQFAYVASHDLQEPLRMVASYVQLLDRRYRAQLDATAKEFMDYAVEGATRMRGLIEDLLAYSRVGTHTRTPKPLELDSIVQSVTRLLEPAILEAQAVVTHDPLPRVVGDETQLVQLFQNLIANAIKFRGTEPPRVHVSARREPSEWVIAVRDNGIGIEPQHAERIFVIFQRLHPRDRYPGSGIGLAIAKKIVERHGGRIWVESALGQGTTFLFTIPRARSATTD